MDTDAIANQAPQPERAHTRRLAVWLAVIGVIAGITLGGGAVWLLMRPSASARIDTGAADTKPLYQCPMHPSVTSDHPGDCPICGMKLVEVKRETAPPSPAPTCEQVQGLSTVTIDPTRQQLIGLRAAPVTVGEVAPSFRTVGRVQVDPTRVRKTNVKIEGYIERMFVDFVGRPVRSGEALFSLYSPSVLAAENEYILALETKAELAKGGALVANGDTLVASARRKLALWDVPASEIDRLERTRQPSKTLTFLSPISGVVTAKNVVEGARVNPGDTPYEITDLSMVWVMADAYETDLPQVTVGMPASFSLQAYPGRTFVGEVAFIDPLMDPKTRTAKVHMHFANPKQELKPEMYGEVTLEGLTRQGLRIPTDAVVRSGVKDVVFLSLGNGKFEPREVQLGATNGDLVEVNGGLALGQEIVTHANFLVDSESQLRASLAAIGGKQP